MLTTSRHTDEDLIKWKSWIGLKVSKSALSKKNLGFHPFKSRLKSNTVKSLKVNPYTNKPAFTFIEDDSFVDCYICQLSNNQ